ncbi:transporter substrate-binding domain-containing protein [Maricurvus nonylphenolicus]
MILYLPCIVSAETVRLATVDWPPFFGEQLPKGGFVTEIARQAFKREGHHMDLVFIPWKRAMYSAQKGDHHGLFGCWINSEVQGLFDVSREIMASGDGHFLALEGSNNSNLRPEDLIGKRIGIVRGYAVSETLGALFDSGKVIRVEVSRIKQLLDMIQWPDRIDLMLENALVARHVFQHHYPYRSYNLEVVGKDYVDGGLYICWSKNNAKSKNFRITFDRAIAAMRQDGTLDRIRAEFNIHNQITKPPASPLRPINYSE